MQKQELEYQRQELIETRKVFENQSKTQNKQRFENTFFELVRVHNEKATLDRLPRSRMQRFIDSIGNNKHVRRTANLDISTKEIYEHVRKDKELEYYTLLLPYLTNIFNIFWLIDNSPLIEPADRAQYFRIVRGLLDKTELDLIWNKANYNGWEAKLKEIGFLSDEIKIKYNPSKQPTISIIG